MISTPCKFFGAYRTDDLRIDHIWPEMVEPMKRQHTRRTAFVTSVALSDSYFEKNPRKLPVDEIRWDDWVGYLSLLYGKRFDFHGIWEAAGLFGLPNMRVFSELHQIDVPHNSDEVREDIPIPLNFTEVKRLEALIGKEAKNNSHFDLFNAACRFYALSLQNFEHDPEVAYLHLISAGEIITSNHGIGDDDLYDEETQMILSAISEEMTDGVNVVKRIKGKLRQIKRRFGFGLESLLDDDFFRDESALKIGRANISECLRAAYDLRSQYVHTGFSFGSSVARTMMNEEVLIGWPAHLEGERLKAIKKAPTYRGLERVMRYCLLRFAEQNFNIELKEKITDA